MNKSSQNKSTLEIDPIKMLLFFLFFVALALLILVVLIVPSAREYKKTKTSYLRQELATRQTEQILSQKEQHLQKIIKGNSKLLDALSARFDREDFIAYADKFFKNVKLSKAKNQKALDGYTIYELNVTSSLKTPSNFYNFLDGLESYKNVVKVGYPITMQAHGTNIKASFSLKVYRNDELR